MMHTWGMTLKRALVTGASTGIGEATVRSLVASGWQVFATARRTSRLEKLRDETGCEIFAADLTSPAQVEQLVAAVGGPLGAVVHVAGGAIGTDRVEDGSVDVWRRMYEMNVLGTLDLTGRVLPLIREAGGGSLVFVTSTAAHGTYPGGAGYVAAKHAERQIPATLRLELAGEPIRVIEIAPGMVQTAEFSLNRLGSQESADNVYEGVDGPLVAEDIAEAIRWSLDAPDHMNVDLMVLRPVAQSSNTDVCRVPLRVKES